MKNRSRGFSLVVVLALVAIASVVVFTSLKDTVVQERLAGNFQKSINARMLSESGVFQQMDAIQSFLAANPTATAQDLALGIAKIESSSRHANDLQYTAEVTQTSGTDLAIDGYGERFGGNAVSNLLFGFRIRQTGENSPFSTALIGCEGVSSEQGGRIDSYDSKINNGIYDVANATSDADVLTIERDADIILGGGSITAGNVTATGEVTVSDGAFVGGSIRANGIVRVQGGIGPTQAGFPANTRIGGDIETQNHVFYKGGLLLGVIRSERNVTFRPVYGIADLNGTGTPIQYGGTLTFVQSARDVLSNPGTVIDHSAIQPTPNLEVPEVQVYDPNDIPADFDPEDPLTNCDPLSIASQVADISAGVTPEAGVNIVFGSGDAFFSPTAGEHNGTDFTPSSESAFGINLNSFYFLDELNIDGGALHITGGDVVMVVEGDFSFTTNFRSELFIEEGSSLTLIVKGKSVVSNEATIAKPQITDIGLPPLSLYSAYESSPTGVCDPNTADINSGVVINATTESYLAIYAPLTQVEVRGRGAISGAVRGKTIGLCGGGNIHFDVDLRNIVAGSGNGGNASAAFEGLRYKAVY